MNSEIITTFSPEHFEMAKLWARGVQTFWPDHPPVRVLADGKTTDDQLRQVSDLCGGRFVGDATCLEVLRGALLPDIFELAREVFWVRFVFQQYLCCQADIVIWDDVDGLFLRRPETWIAALKEYPDACTSVFMKAIFNTRARALWARVKPDLPALRREPTPVVGTHSAPRSLIVDQLPLCEEYLRLWAPTRGTEPSDTGSVCAMGLWQGLAGSHDKRVGLSPRKYQIDYLSLQHEPELYHGCSEKYAKWFWGAFLVGYARHLDDPQGLGKEAWWLQESE